MKIKINGKELECDGKKTILEICDEQGIAIPRLCIVEDLTPEARCRLCLVEMKGKIVPSCSRYPSEGCEIITNSKKVARARHINAELLMAGHSKTCAINGESNYLCDLIHDMGLQRIRFDQIRNYDEDLSESVIRDDNKCINCGKCVRMCGEIMDVHAIDFADRGYNEHVSPYSGHRLHDVACIKCGQCILACPVGAIYEREHLYEVIYALQNGKHVVVQTAPSVRVALGEEFGMQPGTIVTGKMVSALKKIGFSKVFDTDFGADLTIMEEAAEFLERMKKGGPFPMITTCCPAWIKYMEHFTPELFPNMSSCKSPHEMMGILVKTYYAQKAGIDPKDIVVVSVMPCTAKKFESTRIELESAVDYVLTTRELAKLIRHFKIDFANLKDEQFDNPLGESSGAGLIFGSTGGVMEAALRTGYEIASGKKLEKIDFEEIRGIAGIKEGKVNVNGKEIKFAVAHGGKNISELLKSREKYHFIEMMACPGGCIGGGGQPWPTTKKVILERMKGIYSGDKNLPIRKSHENPAVKQIYSEFLGKPLSEKSHKLLHTKYTKRSEF